MTPALANSIRSVFILLAIGVDTGPAQEFHDRARAAKDNQNWTELETVAREWIGKDASSPAARAYLAVAMAGLRRFEECVVALQALDESGNPPDKSVSGIGAPMAEVVNAVHSHC